MAGSKDNAKITELLSILRIKFSNKRRAFTAIGSMPYIKGVIILERLKNGAFNALRFYFKNAEAVRDAKRPGWYPDPKDPLCTLPEMKEGVITEDDRFGMGRLGRQGSKKLLLDGYHKWHVVFSDMLRFAEVFLTKEEMKNYPIEGWPSLILERIDHK